MIRGLWKTIVVAALLSLATSGAHAQSLEVLQRFSALPTGLDAPLIQGTDGQFYGTSFAGGDYGYGTIFRLDSSGAATVLHSFNGMSGRRPGAGLIQASDGAFYGTTELGGTWGFGTIFRMDAAGTVQVLYDFDEFRDTGANPKAALFQAADGFLYGTSTQGGGFATGTIFRVDPATGAFTLLHRTTNAEGRLSSQLMQASDGLLYGTFLLGGPSGRGSVYRMDLAGTVTVLHGFSDADTPASPLTEGANGLLYGVTGGGGNIHLPNGTVFQIDFNGGYSVVHSFIYGPFPGVNEGVFPSGRLTLAPDGFMYGTTLSGGPLDLGTTFRINSAGVFDSLYSFDGTVASKPGRGGLVLAADGLLYGTSLRADGVSTVFRVSTAGVTTSVHAFADTLGASPDLLIQGSDGYLYGTDSGRLSRISQAGAFDTVHSFAAEGGTPNTLIQGSDGSLYGTTTRDGGGTIFKFDPVGGFETLRTLDRDNDGSQPTTLVEGGDGSLYGATREGGAFGIGTIFKLDPNGTFTVLNSFEGWEASPPNITTLTAGADGLIYGTTDGGGEFGAGTVFQMDGTGALALLYTFDGDAAWGPTGLVEASAGSFVGATQSGEFFRVQSNGAFTSWQVLGGDTGEGPQGALALGPGGIVYGVMGFGGLVGDGSGQGTVVRFNPQTGAISVPHVFTGGAEGAAPKTLVRGSDGLFYGTTRAGAGGIEGNGGVLFRLDAVSATPPGSNVEVQPIDPVTGTTPVSLTFGEVVTPGETTVTVSPVASVPPPANFSLGDTPTYFDVETTATFAGAIQVCFNYGPLNLASPATASLLHFDGTAWVDVTTSNNLATTTICGSVTSLSPFVIGNALVPPLTARAAFDQDKVYKVGSTIPIRIQILENGLNVSSSSLHVVATGIRRKTVETNWGVPEDPGASNPDLNFRFAMVDGQPGYQFNLKTKGYSRGTYELKFTVGTSGLELTVDFQVR